MSREPFNFVTAWRSDNDIDTACDGIAGLAFVVEVGVRMTACGYDRETGDKFGVDAMQLGDADRKGGE